MSETARRDAIALMATDADFASRVRTEPE
jgi:hypothetical protein